MQRKCSYIIQLASELKKHTKLIKENYIDPFRAAPLLRVHTENFNVTLVGSQENQVRSHLGGLAHFSCEYIIFL